MPTGRVLCVVLALITLPTVFAQKRVDKLSIKPTPGSPARTPIKALPLTSRQNNARPKRSLSHIVTECMLVTSDEGTFYVKAKEDSDQVCGIFFMSEPDQIIELHFNFLDVSCQDGGLVAFVDGWELNGQVFPGSDDHDKPFEDRFQEFCGVKSVKKILISSQNAALIQYRLPRRGSTFSFNIRHTLNPRPCNVLLEGSTSIFTVRNYAKSVNCSLTTMFPARLRILALSVGVPSFPHEEIETGLLHKCRKRGLDDYLQIGGTMGLDTSRITLAAELCGLDSKPDGRDVVVGCPMSTARLVSSGRTDNSVTLSIHMADVDDILDFDVMCQV